MSGRSPAEMNARRLALLAAVLAVAAFFVWRATRPEPITVVTGTVDRGRVERSVANTRAGTVNACRRARLAPQSGGQIAALPVKEGQRVRAGDVLLELWSEDVAGTARAATDQAESSRLRAEEACLRADVAERDAERARKLNADGLLPDDQLDRATSTAKTLRAGCRAAQAEVRRSRSQQDVARAGMSRTVLRAPFAGVVANITGEIGEFTTPSPPGIPTPPAVDLIDDSCLYVNAPIDEVDVARVRVGQTGYITIEALPDRRFKGSVRRIAPYVLDLERQARTVDVEVAFVDPAEARTLLVGYSADVEIILDARDDVLRVPTEALLEGNRLYVLDPQSGTLQERKIETGLANWEFTEVRSGLRQGEKVVVSPEREGVVAGVRAVAETPRAR